MFGNVLTSWGLLLRLTEFILPPPHPSVKEMYPGGAFPTIKLRGAYPLIQGTATGQLSPGEGRNGVPERAAVAVEKTEEPPGREQ